MMNLIADHDSPSLSPAEQLVFDVFERGGKTSYPGLIARTGERRRNIGSTVNAAAYRPTPLALSVGTPSTVEGSK